MMLKTIGSIPLTNDNKIPKRPWSNLPPELLSLIADRLGLIELLSLRGVCKDWRSASSTASAQIESATGAKPYFLLQGDDGKCALYDQRTKKKYTINIPELKEATCLASNQGWLLLFQSGSVFFFCPFSRARIDLPKFPHSETSDHVAAFSSPISPDCIVSIINRSDKYKVELNVLRRGADTWTKHEYDRHEDTFGPVTCATYSKGTFYYVDNMKSVVTFSVNEKTWALYRIVVEPQNAEHKLSFGCYERYSHDTVLRKWMKLKDDVSISTCGAVLPHYVNEILIRNENLKGSNGSAGRQLKGVWIQPRFYQIPLNQSW